MPKRSEPLNARRALNLGKVCVLPLVLIAFATAGCGAKKDPFQQQVTRMATPDRLQTDVSKSQLATLPSDELTMKGSTYFRQGNLQLARLHFATALQKDPNYRPAMAGLGDVLYRQGDMTGSRDLFTRVLNEDPDNFRALLGLGRIARDRGEYEKAMEFLYQAKDLQPESAEALTELAMAHDLLGQGNLALAEPLYREALSLQPDDPNIQNNLGFNLALQGRYPEAISYLSRALSMERDNARIKNNLATALLLNNQESEALQLFENSIGKAAAFNNIGYLYMTQGIWDKAEQSFRKALQTSPTFYLRAQQNLDRLRQLRTQAIQGPQE